MLARWSSVLWVVMVAGSAVNLCGDDWPQWRGPRRDGIWRETGLIDRFDGPEIKPLWRVPVGAGYSGPTVADGRVFLTDRITQPNQLERVHCFDAKSGTTLWKFEYPCIYAIGYEAGPRACVTIDGERAFALGAMGHLHCFRAVSGDLLWKHDCQTEYQIAMPGWGIAAAPLVYENLVIVHIGGKGASIVAFDKSSGKEAWRALNDRAQYSAPILIQQAGKPVVVCWTGDSVAGLNPGTGKVYWRYEFKPRKMPIGVATPVVNGDRIFFTSFYDGSLMLRLKQDSLDQNSLGVEQLWHRNGLTEENTDALQSIISTPLFLGEYIYGVDSYGQLRCLRADNGDRVWEDLKATPKARWSTIHFVQNGERSWMFNEKGELIIATLSPAGYHEVSRAKLLNPTRDQLPQRGGVCWSHPAFANGHVFARNDEELVCASLLTGNQTR